MVKEVFDSSYVQEGGKFIPEVEDGHPGVEQVSANSVVCHVWVV